jgi:hypothetical protein
MVMPSTLPAYGSRSGRSPRSRSRAMAVTDKDAFVAASELRREFFVLPYPVTTTAEVMRLCDRALLVEMSAIAEIPLGRFRRF